MHSTFFVSLDLRIKEKRYIVLGILITMGEGRMFFYILFHKCFT